jgi:uncharacterized membrane protein YphA (DoxX/SURF4 family)
LTGSASDIDPKMGASDPASIKFQLGLTILMELGGGLMLLGWQVRLAATAIFLWTIPVTLVFPTPTGGCRPRRCRCN